MRNTGGYGLDNLRGTYLWREIFRELVLKLLDGGKTATQSKRGRVVVSGKGSEG